MGRLSMGRLSMGRLSMARGAGALLALALTASSIDAAAQSSAELSGARAAAEQGLDAFDAERYADAVDLFARAEAVVHSPVHLLFMARSEEKLGRLVAAKEHYMKVVTEVLPSGASPIFVDAQRDAEAELAQLQPRIPRLTVKVEGADAQPAALLIDGAELSAALIGVPQPVDPGEHEISARAAGMQSSLEHVSLAEGGEQTVTVTLTVDPTASSDTEAAQPGEGSASASVDARRDLTPAEGTGTLTLVGYGALGLGVVGLGAGAYFALDARSSLDEANTLCHVDHPDAPAGACPDTEQATIQDLDDSARSANTLSVVGFAVGGVGIAAGITLLLLDSGGGSEEAAARAPGVEPWVGLGSAGVRGRF